MSGSILDNLQTEIANVLSETPALNGIPVLCEDPHDLTFEIERAIYSLGIVVVVLLPTARRQNPNERGPVLEAIDLRVRVEENTRLHDGTGGAEIAEAVIAALHLHRVEAVGDPLYAGPDVITLISEPPLLTYEVPLTTEPPRG